MKSTKDSFNLRNQNCQTNDNDKIKMIIQILAKIEYENYLEIKEKMNSTILLSNGCGISHLTEVNCKAA
jgi:hypothetical protein